MKRRDSFKTMKSLSVGGKSYQYFSLKALDAQLPGIAAKLPKSLKVLLENLLRHEDGITVTKEHIGNFAQWLTEKKSRNEISYYPARVLMQDFTGVPAVVDLASMREAVTALGGDPDQINPLSPVDLVIDHSVAVDNFGTADAFSKNVSLEFERNGERYEFLRWAQSAFKNFKVVPPGTGICHQVNLENLAKVVFAQEVDGKLWAYPDTLVGTDSHTTMVNGLSVLGWGVGGIEAEAAMLNQPVTMLIPEVIGVKLEGKLSAGVTATDMVLTITEALRKRGVVDKFVEYFGPGLKGLSLADRATIANMAPEYGATCGFFPIDEETLNYLRLTGRSAEQIALVEAYAKEQGLWWIPSDADPVYTDVVTVDLSSIEPCIAGPKRPQDRIVLREAQQRFAQDLKTTFKVEESAINKTASVEGADFELKHGSVVIAAITSCTNTSNPSVLITAGLLAEKAVALGLKSKPWVKTSLAPGSQVVTDYLHALGLDKSLDALGFNLVGYGCTTCIGNSGSLSDPISKSINQNQLIAAAVLSGNRNFEGRINPDIKANFLASPPLVVAYALAGNVLKDLTKEPLGMDTTGKPVFLKDIWPSPSEINTAMNKGLSPEMFRTRYAKVFEGPEKWQAIKTTGGKSFVWADKSTYVRRPPFFANMPKNPPGITEIKNARILAVFGDSITTDHISPAGSIKEDSPAGTYLKNHGIAKKDFNSFGARRGNHEVMMRGTFANIRIKNKMLDGKEGGFTLLMPEKKEMSIYDAAMEYQERQQNLVIFAGKEYGTGSSRDWAAKGTFLLGVRAVIAESFERIHRSNLIGMGVLPLEFSPGESAATLNLKGDEVISFESLSGLTPRAEISLQIARADSRKETIKVRCRVDTENELSYLKNGGILHYVLRQLVS